MGIKYLKYHGKTLRQKVGLMGIENSRNSTNRKGFTDLYEKEYIRKNETIFSIQVQVFLLNTPKKIEDALIAHLQKILQNKKCDTKNKRKK